MKRLFIQGSHHQGKSGENISFWKVRESQGILIFFVKSQRKSGILVQLVLGSQEKCPRNVRESQGIQIELMGGKPVYSHSLNF